MEQDLPERRRIVVDGSNIATEGRTMPSLAQLDEAIRAFLEEYRGFTTSDVTVVVDASFGHRIDPSELAAFDQAVEHGEMITPPAGAIGRGDGFILRIAEKSGALVLSNDSFQEFHAERPWLFEPGRLIGGKPVPGVGWIFTPRTPVRGARSRSVTSKSKRGEKAADAGRDLSSDGLVDGPGPDSAPTRTPRGSRGRSAKAADRATESIEVGAGEPTEPAPKATKATKAAKPAKSTKTTKAGKSAGGAKATKATKATKAGKAATGATKSAGAEPADTAEPARAAKATKLAKATKKATTKATKATKATKTSGPVKEAKTPGPTKAAKAQKGSRTPTVAAAAPTTDNGRNRPGAAPEALNEPMTFLTFVAEHPVGSTFDGTVVSFTSHGAHVDVGGMLCHIPLRGLAVPPPKKARQVLAKGETRQFQLVSLDAARRRAELALPGVGG